MARKSSVQPREVLQRYMAGRGLKFTAQRRAVLDAFLETRGHVSLEALHQRVRQRAENVGYTTVYRTMKLLSECGIAETHAFGNGATVYELAHQHHDHLICTGCGRIIEFEDERIEELQQEAARKHGFVIVEHKLELYGLCEACRGAPAQ